MREIAPWGIYCQEENNQWGMLRGERVEAGGSLVLVPPFVERRCLNIESGLHPVSRQNDSVELIVVRKFGWFGGFVEVSCWCKNLWSGFIEDLTFCVESLFRRSRFCLLGASLPSSDSLSSTSSWLVCVGCFCSVAFLRMLFALAQL